MSDVFGSLIKQYALHQTGAARPREAWRSEPA
jgi:hypothetical protein